MDLHTSDVEGSPRATCTRARSLVIGVRSSCEALATKCQLAELEGLGQVVVGTEPEPFDPVFDRSGGGEHQHPAGGPVCHQGPADVVSMGAGQVTVEDHDVVAVDRQMGDGVVAAEGNIDRHSLPAQPDGHCLGQHFVVFGYQHSHAPIMAPTGCNASALPSAAGC
ncbi:MAG TPA: hypothetical protein VMF65_05720 [Acidimicrobiales bacterium]|nr:hypothetical protein [Acidimicrobiales bacterium]